MPDNLTFRAGISSFRTFLVISIYICYGQFAILRFSPFYVKLGKMG